MLLSQILAKTPEKRITVEDVQKNAWYNKGFESEAPRKYRAITVTNDQVAGAVSTAKLTAEIAGADAAAPSGAPT